MTTTRSRSAFGVRLVYLLVAFLLPLAGCFGQGEYNYEIHRTAFENEWETIRVDNVGVDIDLPKQPRFGGLSRYEILTNRPDVCCIKMHRFLYQSTPDIGACLDVRIHRYAAAKYGAILKENSGKLIFGWSTWDPKRILDGIQERRPDKRVREFLKCYKAPDGDVIVVGSYYSLNDESDVKAIKRMINSVKPYR